MAYSLTRRRAMATVAIMALAGFHAASAQQKVAAGSAGVVVKIDNFTFTPAEITIPSGTTVTWKNSDDIPHTVAASNKTFRSKVMDTDQEYSFTFATPGEFEYFCSLHPHMKGKVIVK